VACRLLHQRAHRHRRRSGHREGRSARHPHTHQPAGARPPRRCQPGGRPSRPGVRDRERAHLRLDVRSHVHAAGHLGRPARSLRLHRAAHRRTAGTACRPGGSARSSVLLRSWPASPAPSSERSS
jgi:hypothetical protein